ncbi:DUF1616 domain-containing protein [Caldivirga sp.]|uniref:DUF1616 domain-containing protein n=1 Tax=Caldivirga sp. TaxID=2080243 RepID=UPI003D0B6228
MGIEDEVKDALKGMNGRTLGEVVDELARRLNVSREYVAFTLLKMRLRGELTFNHCSGTLGFLASAESIPYWLMVTDLTLASLLALVNSTEPLIGALRIILGVPAYVYLPGYALIKAIYPVKSPFTLIETMLASIGFSLALLSLIALLLSLTVGLTVTSLLASVPPLSIIMLTIGYIRDFQAKASKLPIECLE